MRTAQKIGLITALFLLITGCSNDSSSPEVPASNSQKLVSQGDGNFGVVDFNATKVKSFTFKNDSSASVSLSPEIIGGHFEQLSLGCQSVEAGRSCLVRVIFKANKEAGTYDGQLKIGSLLLPLQAVIETVPAVSYQFHVDGVEILDTHAAGNVVGNNIKLMTVKVKNNSPKAGNVSSLVSSSNKFSLAYNSCNNLILKPNQSCFAKILVKGDNSGSSISTNLSFDNQGPEISLIQEHTNLDANLQPIKSELTLSDVYREGEDRIQLISIKNEGKSTGSISDISLPPGFTLATNSCLSVRPGSSCVIRVVYKTSNIPTGQYQNQIDLGDDVAVQVTVNKVTDPSKLNKIEVSAVNSSLINNCIPFVVSLKDTDNLDYITSQEVQLVSNQTLFSDAACQVENNKLAPFEPSKTFYLKQSSAGEMNLQVGYKDKSAQKIIYWYNELVANIDKILIVTNQVAQVTVSGGKSPYSYSVLLGTGNISETGLYTPVAGGDVVLQVVDALNLSTTVSVKVVLPLQIVAERTTQMASSTQSFSVTGGLAPVTYSIVSGGGTINQSSGLYTAGAVSGNVTIKAVDSSNQSSELTIIVASVLNISPTTSNVITSQSKSFAGSGGVLPYNYSVTGVGTINSTTGLFSAGVIAGTSQVKVTDAIGQTATASVVVATPLTLSSQKTNQIVNTQQTLSGAGGVTPYVYSLVSGLGSIDANSGVFSAGANAGVVTLKVSDNSGQSAEISVNVVSVLTISPSTSSVIVGSSSSFTGVGGLSPYSYSVVSGNGNVNSSTGQFTAPNNPGTTTIRVTDALNQTADANITIAVNIAITAGNCSYSIPESMPCTVTSSGGLGSRTYTTSSGTINATTGEFKGVCVNNLGSSVVTVTDQYNNSATVTLSYPCVYTSCNQIKQENFGTVSALYWLDFDGLNTGLNPAQYYCEQSYNTGGWMLVSANNANSSLIASGTGRNNASHQLDRPTPLGSPDPNSDYIIGSSVLKATFDQVLVVAFGGTPSTAPNTGATFPSNLQTNVTASWRLSSTGDARFLEIVPRSNVTITGTIAPSASYFILDAVKRDGQAGGYNANSDQSTVGGAGVSHPGGDPYDGTYLGHGTSEGNFEGWYYTDNSANRYNAQGYTTWVKDTYYKLPRTCADAKTRGSLNTNGVSASGNFLVDPDGYNLGVSPYLVYCDFNGNGSTLDATGGTITYDGNYKIHTFKAPSNTTSSYTFTITQGSGSAEYLVVAGGGGGGGRSGGGGGAGGLKNNITTLSPGNVSVIVGAGGAGGSGNSGGNGLVGGNGANSQFGASIVSNGGGGGAGDAVGAQVGGSGGGGKYGANGAAGISGQGNAGGSGTANSWAGGGGGGAGTVGVNGAQGKCGNGGTGFLSSISGVGTYYAGGGGGGSHNPAPGYGSPCGQGIGGNGGGGNGGLSNTYNSGDNGADDFGGGGGGGSTISGAGGNGGRGGSGIVIIRYQYKLQ